MSLIFFDKSIIKKIHVGRASGRQKNSHQQSLKILL